MFELTIEPRFSETDALGHINNTVIPIWFEQGRTPIFRMFVPNLDVSRWSLVLARIEIDYLREIFYGTSVEIRTGVEKIGNTSYVVSQELWQEGEKKATGRTVAVCFDTETRKSSPIPEAVREQLTKHLIV